MLSIPINDGTTRAVEVNSSYTLTTKDKVECRFNSGGQLIYLADANGNIVLVEYDTFYGVPTKITTGQNASITFNYDTAATGDPLLVDEVVLADGQILQYTYSGNKLIKVTEVGDAADATDDIVFEYGYEAYSKMNQLKDGNGNLYEITYDDYNRVTLVEYPSTTDENADVHTEAVQFVYTANDNTNTSTVTNKLVDDGIVATETDYFDPAYGSRTKHIDAEGYITEYAFKDNMPAETRYEVEYSEILDGIIEKKTTYKVDKNQYNENDNVETQQDNEDTVTYYTYSTEAGKTDLVTSMVEKTAAGVTIANETYQYDEKRNVIVEKDLINNTITRTTYNYTGAGKGEIATQKEYVLNETSEILQTSTTNTYAYNSQGDLVVTRVETSDGTTVTTVTTYDAAGKIKTEEYTYVNTDGSKHRKVLTNTYDGHGRIERQVTTESDLSSAGEVDSATTIEFTTQIEYDGNGNVTRKEENDGTIYTYQFNDSNNLIRETVQKDGASKYLMSEYAYEDVTIHTGIGTGATKTYSKAYVVTESLIEGSSTIVISKKYHDAIGRVIREISGNVQTDYCYDAQGQITSIYKVGLMAEGDSIVEDTKTENHEILLYDANGNQTSHVQRPVWNAETEKFSIGENSIVTTNVYDSRGNILSITDALGRVTQYTYNANDEITSVTLPDGTKTTYEYDVFDTADNKLKDVTTYANGAVTETKYNATGKVLSITDKGDKTIVKTYEFDSQDNMTKELYSKGNYKTYEYDARDRVVAINYHDGTSVTARTEYTYNTADLVTAMIDYNVSETTKTPYRYTGYFYDSFNRLSGKAELNVTDMPSEDAIEAAKIIYEYDINDNVIEAKYPAIGGMEAHSLVYEYDSTKQRLMEVSRVSGNSTTVLRTYEYRSDGKIEKTTANGINESYRYDAFDRLESKTYTDGEIIKESHTYTYDKNHNIVREVIVNNWATTAVNETREYMYDAIGQLISSTITPVDSSTGITTTYTYDSVGNRKTETVGGTSTTEYTYNNLNQLTVEKIFISDALSAEIEYDYDANGNLISAVDSVSGLNKTYGYDASNQMISYSEGTVVQTNMYNGNGQRIRKTEGSDVTNFFYEDDALLYTTDGNNVLKAFQLYDGYGELFATARTTSSGDVLYYYTDDARGSITNLVDGSKTGVVSYTYTDFGETTEANGGSFYNEIRFTGGVYDENTGLYYLNARFYDPANGRFLNPDSYRGEPADPQSLHLYAYCANNPINNVDPSGNIIETALDAASLVDSVVNFAVNPTLGNLAYVAADTVALAVPGVPSTGTAKAVVKATSKISKTKVAAKASKAVGKVVSKGKSAAKIQSAKVTKKVTNKATNSTKLKKVTAQKNQRKVKASTGRSGKQARLKALLNDDKLPSALKGEIKRDLNEIKRGKRKNIRVPSGYELAHKRGYEARKGYGYEYSNLNTKKDHRRQHKFDNNGRKR